MVLALAVGCGRPQPDSPDEISLRAAQRVEPSFVEKLELPRKKERRAKRIIEDLEREFESYDEARLLLLDETLRQVRSGELDRDSLEPLGHAAEDEFLRAMPALMRALNEGHALLSTEERKRFLSMYGSDKEKKSDEERRAAREQKLARVLDLSAGQKTRLYAAWLGVYLAHLSFIRQMRKDFRQAREAFASDSFDAKTLPLLVDPRFEEVLELIYEALSVTLPMLSADQRLALAAYMDAHMR